MANQLAASPRERGRLIAMSKIRRELLIADFSVDRSDSHKFRQVLHFGLQNLYDPNLDESIVMQKFSDKPGNVLLPDACNNATAPPPLSVPSG